MIRDNTIRDEVDYLSANRYDIINIDSKLKGKRLTRNIFNYYKLGFVDDKQDTLDNYYVQLINDSLNSIRKGKEALVFKTDQLKDILRFEPDANFRYDDQDEVIYIWK